MSVEQQVSTSKVPKPCKSHSPQQQQQHSSTHSSTHNYPVIPQNNASEVSFPGRQQQYSSSEQ